MIQFNEDVVSTVADKVYYQSPEDLKVKQDPTPDVVHDDSLPVATQIDGSVKTPEIDASEIEEPAPARIYTKPAEDLPNPVDAIRMSKANPCNVVITKVGDKYYIDHNDLKCYMDACGEHDYSCAVRNIISAHNEEFTNDDLGIVMSENDLFNLGPDAKATIEASDVNFEVYE